MDEQGFDKRRFKTFLNYWMEHNREHADEFRAQAVEAGKGGESGIASDLVGAARELDKANEYLEGALQKLKLSSGTEV
ncbi:MAG: hypothetical protein V1737_03060 [Chloroflexota bacterium]